MKKVFWIIILGLCNNLYSQNKLIGTWIWNENENYDVEIRFDDKYFEFLAYGKGNDSKLHDYFFKYSIDNDTISFYSATSQNDSVIFIYVIKSITDNEFNFLDPGDESNYLYKRLSTEKPQIFPIRLNEFHYLGNALAYVSDSSHNNNDENYSIGWIKLKTKISKIDKELGNPVQILDGINGIKNRIYLLDTIDNNINYIVISEKSDTINAIQLTGYKSNLDFSFSSVRLGDYSSYVDQKLGPMSTKEKVEDINGEIWRYDPFPFSIEFVNDRVYSIRLTRY